MVHRILINFVMVIFTSCFILFCFVGVESQEIEYLGSTLFGADIFKLNVEGAYAYCNMLGGFKILDITNPDVITSPGDCPFIKESYSGKPQIRGNYVYITGRISNTPSFAIIDISEPENPFIAGALDSLPLGRVVVNDSYAYINYASPYIDIVNITDPFNPTIAGRYENEHAIYDMAVSGHYLYIVVPNSGLDILDISNPTEPVFINRYLSSHGIIFDKIIIIEGYAYITVVAAYQIRIIEILDLSDPSNPQSIGYCDLEISRVDQMHVRGDYIYSLSHASNSDSIFFEIINAEDPENPYLVWRDFIAYTWYYSNDIHVSDNRAYINIFGINLYIMDISDPSAPVLIGSYREPRHYGQFAVIDNYVYDIVRDGISIIDISDYSRPRVVGSYDIPNWPRHIDVSGDFAYTISDKLRIFDISELELPVPVGEYQAPDYIHGIDVEGRYAYLTVHGHELQIVDVENPYRPVLAGECAVPDADDIFVSGNTAYITRSFTGHGFSVVDVLDPGAPVILGNYDSSSHIANIYAHGDLLYAASNDLLIFDVSYPPNPNLIASYDTPSSAKYVYVDENFAYVIGSYFGLIMVDISNPLEPVFVSEYVPPSQAVSCYVSGEYIYLADSGSLIILRFYPESGIIEEVERLPRDLSLYQNYPNPFNPSTTISYSLPEQSNVRIEIYNILGEKAETVYEGMRDAGEYSVVWDASKFPSGIYFARLGAGRWSETTKMVLLK